MSNPVTVIILGGGQGKRLFPLTSYRSKPAVPMGGKYRLVDIPISNAINSGFRKIFVLTQFNSASLHRHIHRTYPYEYFHQTSVELLAAEQTIDNNDWFQGTADAVRKHIPHYHIEDNDTILILSGDHLYRMDYREILAFHEKQGADITISTLPVTKREAKHFGIMQIRANGHITNFWEKPSPDEDIHSFIIPETIRNIFEVKGKSDLYLASMGIYVFKAKVLKDVLKGRETDFGKEVIPKAINDKYNVYGYVFNDYWRDIGTIRSFFDANIELTAEKPPFSFMAHKSVIFTRARFLPPAKIAGAKIKNSLLGEGCMMHDCTIEDSVIGVRSIIREGSVLKKVVMMGSDFYESDKKSRTGLGIGKNCRIENCILDKNVLIGNNVTITNAEQVEEKDGENFHIREGIVIIPKGVSIPDGTTI